MIKWLSWWSRSLLRFRAGQEVLEGSKLTGFRSELGISIHWTSGDI